MTFINNFIFTFNHVIIIGFISNNIFDTDTFVDYKYYYKIIMMTSFLVLH